MNFTTKGIKNRIRTHGPVESAFGVYQDFYSYKTGVYEHVTGRFVGAHAIKLIGWGETDDGVQYWIAQNSWGKHFGEDGFFNIKLHNCMIGTTGVSCEPKV
jgi:cathepsin B